MIGLGPVWQIGITLPGAITADKTLYYTAPADLQLVHITAQCITQNATVVVSDDGTPVNDRPPKPLPVEIGDHMARKPTLSEIRTFLTELGLGPNPIEQITHHKDGAVTVWVVGLAEAVQMPAPSPPRPARAPNPPV